MKRVLAGRSRVRYDDENDMSAFEVQGLAYPEIIRPRAVLMEATTSPRQGPATLNIASASPYHSSHLSAWVMGLHAVLLYSILLFSIV